MEFHNQNKLKNICITDGKIFIKFAYASLCKIMIFFSFANFLFILFINLM
jgi:hypothetical protein